MSLNTRALEIQPSQGPTKMFKMWEKKLAGHTTHTLQNENQQMFNYISIKCKRKSTNQHQLRDGSYRDVKCRVWMHVECQIRSRGAPTQHCFLRTCQSPPKALRAKLEPTFLPQVLVTASHTSLPASPAPWGCSLQSRTLSLKQAFQWWLHSDITWGASKNTAARVPSQRIWRKWSGERQLTSILNKLPPTQPGLKSSQSWEPPVLEASLQNTLKQ